MSELAVRNSESPAPIPAEQERAIVSYENISAKPLTDEQRDKILAVPPLEWLKQRPDGMVYVDGVHYRDTLDDIFGVAGWALRPTHSHLEPGDMKGKPIVRVFVQGQLWAEGRFISESVGEDIYYLNNNADSYATAWEKAKSNLLVRCCKELGLFRKMWDKDWVNENKRFIGTQPEQAKQTHAVNTKTGEITENKIELNLKKSLGAVPVEPEKPLDLSVFEAVGMRADKVQGGYIIINHAFMDEFDSQFWKGFIQTKADRDANGVDATKGRWVKKGEAFIPHMPPEAMPSLISALDTIAASINAPEVVPSNFDETFPF